MAKKITILLLVTLCVVSLCIAAIFFKMVYTNELEFNIQNIFDNIVDGLTISSKSEENGSRANQNAQSTFLKLTKRAEENYLDNSVFIGDSRTQAMYLFDFLKNEQVYAKDGLSHSSAFTQSFVDIGQGKAFTIIEALRIQAPKKIFISFGINGIIWYEKQNFINEYKELVTMIKKELPESIIIVTSILPVSNNFAIYEGLSNEKIDDFNTGILELATDIEVFYLDLATDLKNESNALKAEFDSGDGLHLNSHAYEIIFDTINTHAVYDDK